MTVSIHDGSAARLVHLIAVLVFSGIIVVLLAISSFLGSGILFSHKRMVTYIGTALTLWQTQWMLLSYLGRTKFLSVPRPVLFLAGSLFFLGFWAFHARRWKRPMSASRADTFWGNAVPIAVLIVILFTAVRIGLANGPRPDGSWQLHGFYNGDTFLLSALVERSLAQPTLVRMNPAAANAPLPYPSAVHGAIADFLTAFQISNWQSDFLALTVFQILLIIGMFFTLYDTAGESFPRNAKWHVVSGAVALLIMAYSWSDYVFPQTHLFLLAPEILLAAVLLRAPRQEAVRDMMLFAISATAITALLLVSNEILGTVAVAWVLGASLIPVLHQNTSRRIRLFHVALLATWSAVYYSHLVQGNADLEGMRLHISAVDQLKPLIGFGVLLILAAFSSGVQQRVLVWLVSVTMMLSFIVVFFSRNPLLWENAGRFLYESIRLGWPLLVPFLLQIAGRVRALLRAERQKILQVIPPLAAVLVGVSLLCVPALSTVQTVQEGLLMGDGHIITKTELDAVSYLKQHSKPDAVVIADPQMPWSIPFFSGRALVRLEGHWASPQDDLLARLQQAFRGDQEAEREVLTHGDYLLTLQRLAGKWPKETLTRIYKNSDYYVYKIENRENY